MRIKETSKARKVFRVILKVLGIMLAVLAVLIAVLAIRNIFKNKSDRAACENAYGQYYTTKNGDKINYTFYDSESDKVAVILPGYGCASTHYEFDTFANEIADDYKLILIDPLGYGLSSAASTPRTVENYCSEIHDLINSLGYDRYTIIGHSISGIYTLYYANQYTDEVEAFIGIDASVPHQADADTWMAKPKNTVRLYRLMNIGLAKTGIYRTLTELGGTEQYDTQIPTLSTDEKEKFMELTCYTAMNKTQMDEMTWLEDNFDKTYNLKFPESVPVLYVLCKNNAEMMPEWESIHKDLVTNPKSKVVVIEGEHYLHFTNLKGLINEIDNWDYEG
ncbi:MAG: alpha/beta hydrolase [Clostridiales bacterium]|nr:alpha/beta hydrolase [Clostridiales bacterium]